MFLYIIYLQYQTTALYEMREQNISKNQQVEILEKQFSAKEDELQDLKEAYRTKLKKAEAWEKVRITCYT